MECVIFIVYVVLELVLVTMNYGFVMRPYFDSVV